MNLKYIFSLSAMYLFQWLLVM